MALFMPPQQADNRFSTTETVANLSFVGNCPIPINLDFPIPAIIPKQFGARDQSSSQLVPFDYKRIANPRSAIDDPKEDQMAAIRPELARRFREIGDPTGPYRSAAGRAEGYDFWKSFGEASARWLIGQLTVPTNLTTYWGVANILSGIGPEAVGPIVEALSGYVEDEVACTLLSALGGIDPAQIPERADDISAVVRPFLETHADDVVRSRAVGATSSLPRPFALALLSEALANEADVDVREALRDEIDRRD